MLIWIECGVVLAIAIVTTVAFTPFARWLAVKCDAIDYPDKRRVNTHPVPRMGGVAMFGGAIASCVTIKIGSTFFGWLDPFVSPPGTNIDFALLAAGIALMFAVGVVDDIKGLRARDKFIGQVVASCVAAASGLLLHNIQNPFVEGGFIEFGWFSYPITVIYLVCFANVINLIDGLDGLASGICGISAATIFAYAMMASRFDSAVLCVIIIGICLGFLRYNHHPASIFMGDSGSLLLGMGLGIVSLVAVARSTLFISLLVPLLAAGVPIMDTAAAIIRRKRAHQPINAPDKGHIHHRLLSAGFNQETVVLIMWLWTAALAMCALVLAESDGIWRVVAIILAAAITGYAIFKLHLLDPVLVHYYNPRKRTRGEGGDAQGAGGEGARRRESAPVEGHRRGTEKTARAQAPRSSRDKSRRRGQEGDVERARTASPEKPARGRARGNAKRGGNRR